LPVSENAYPNPKDGKEASFSVACAGEAGLAGQVTSSFIHSDIFPKQHSLCKCNKLAGFEVNGPLVRMDSSKW
jgi:hypothetical protein